LFIGYFATSEIIRDNLIYNINRFEIQDEGFSWRLSDCEELVGVTHKGMELFLLFFNLCA
jgi:hypothetical protein